MKHQKSKEHKKCEEMTDKHSLGYCMISYNNELIKVEEQFIFYYKNQLSKSNALYSKKVKDKRGWERSKKNYEYLIKKCEKDIKFHESQIEIIKRNYDLQ